MWMGLNLWSVMGKVREFRQTTKEPNGFVLLKNYKKKYLSRGLHSEIYTLELNIKSISTIMKIICVNLITFRRSVGLAIPILVQLQSSRTKRQKKGMVALKENAQEETAIREGNVS